MNYWEKCVNFHGHECGGLAIGYKAALYAVELLNLKHSKDEEIVCISENDACGVDAIQVILGCTLGKGNLLFHLVGKQAFSFYNRNTGESVRLVLKETNNSLSKIDKINYFKNLSFGDLFEIKETTINLPKKAEKYSNYTCENCKESTAEFAIHLYNNTNLCSDCYEPKHRKQILIKR